MKCTDIWDIFAISLSWYLPNDWWRIYHVKLRVGESESRSVMCNSLWPRGLYSPWNSPGQNTGVGSLSLLQGIFPTQGSNPGLLHCRRILYQLSHKGSPRILDWVAYPFSSGSSQPRNWTGVSRSPVPYQLGCRVGERSIQIAGQAKWILMWQGTQSLLIWFQIPHSSVPLRNHRLLSFGVISEENIHTHLKIFLQYSSHYIHMCKTGFSSYTYFKQKYIITMIWRQKTWECSWFLQPDVRNVHLIIYSLLENSCYIFRSIWYLC